LPMTAGWDHLLPVWFTRLHPKWKTPVNSILFMTVMLAVLLLLSMLGVRAQETMQLLLNASNVHYGVVYVALFALPLFGTAAFKSGIPPWLRVVSVGGLISSLVAVLIAIYPIIGVSSRLSYASKIAGAVIVSNLLGVAVYRGRERRSQAC